MRTPHGRPHPRHCDEPTRERLLPRNAPPRRNPSRRAPAFTIIELLVVIGIILLLIGILLPVVSSVQRAAYNTSSQNLISVIAQACTQYHNDFSAYPGPFSNDAIEFGNVQDTTAAHNKLTMAENLVLGLLGGIDVSTDCFNSGGVTFVNMPGQNGSTFAPLNPKWSDFGAGPISFNPQNPKRYNSYMDAQFAANSVLSYTQSVYTDSNSSNGAPNAHPWPQTEGGGTVSANDSVFPEFVDKFPSALPILYLRARTGAHGIVCDGAVTDPTSTPTANALARYQYDIRDITPYTCPIADQSLRPGNGTTAAVTAPASGATTWTNNLGVTGLKQDLQEIWDPANQSLSFGYTSGNYALAEYGVATSAFPSNASETPPAMSPYNTSDPVKENGAQYLMSQSTAPTNTSDFSHENATGVPRQKDGFILIGAGIDRIYGTLDDETNFGSVQQ